jgi:hypothetical protein
MLDYLYKKAAEMFFGSGKFASIVRHAISAGGGYLVKLGLDPKLVDGAVEPLTQLITGLALLALAVFGSRKNKKQEG